MVKQEHRILKNLTDLLGSRAPLAIAYSGGLDSRFLCFVALRAHIDCLALTVTGPHIASHETRFAKQWAQERLLPLIEYPLDITSLEGLSKNPRTRCYLCKKRMFQNFKTLLLERKEEGRCLCDGSNEDDLEEFRPGAKALKEEAIFSPLQELNLRKAMIRSLASTIGLSYPSQKPSPCLLTRFNYGLSLTKKTLFHLAKAEEELKRLFYAEKRDGELTDTVFRLRLTPTPILTITRFPWDKAKQVHTTLAKHHFLPCYLLESPTISGFYDRPLPSLHNLPLL